MGNLTSKQKTDETVFNNFYEVIDYIASYYILKSDFKSLKKLNNPEYCNKLVLITSDVIKKAFNTRDIQFIAKRIQDGLEVNEMKTNNYTYMTQDQLDNLDIKNTQTGNIKKDDICISISEFYIKIANVFASIVMTINPVFSYKENGVDTFVGLAGREKIPAGVSVNMNKFSFCDNRISALERGKSTLGDITTLNPKICDINLDENGVVKNLSNEPGLLNLENLYLDSNFDYTTGTFTERSKESQEQYMKDLTTFYKVFNGEDKELPPGIDNFAQIVLRDYSQESDCKPENNEILKKTIEVPNKDNLFVKYATHLKDMTTRASNNNKYLLEIINDLFSKKESVEGKSLIRINPKLNDAKLNAIIEQTRILIVRMYAQCELDYLKGVKLYEAIVHSTIYKISDKQLQYFENEAAMMMVDQFEEPETQMPDEYAGLGEATGIGETTGVGEVTGVSEAYQEPGMQQPVPTGLETLGAENQYAQSPDLIQPGQVVETQYTQPQDVVQPGFEIQSTQPQGVETQYAQPIDSQPIDSQPQVFDNQNIPKEIQNVPQQLEPGLSGPEQIVQDEPAPAVVPPLEVMPVAPIVVPPMVVAPPAVAPNPLAPAEVPLAPALNPLAPAPNPLAPAPNPLAPAPNPLAPAPNQLAPAPNPLVPAPNPLAPTPAASAPLQIPPTQRY